MSPPKAPRRRAKKGNEEPVIENALHLARPVAEHEVAVAVVVDMPKGECRGLGYTHAPGSGCIDPSICSASWKCALNTWP